MEPAPKKLISRVKEAALKVGGALLIAFIAYNVALGALKTIVFWVCTGLLGVSGFFAWKFFKGRNSSGDSRRRES